MLLLVCEFSKSSVNLCVFRAHGDKSNPPLIDDPEMMTVVKKNDKLEASEEEENEEPETNEEDLRNEFGLDDSAENCSATNVSDYQDRDNECENRRVNVTEGVEALTLEEGAVGGANDGSMVESGGEEEERSPQGECFFACTVKGHRKLTGYVLFM